MTRRSCYPRKEVFQLLVGGILSYVKNYSRNEVEPELTCNCMGLVSVRLPICVDIIISKIADGKLSLARTH